MKFIRMFSYVFEQVSAAVMTIMRSPRYCASRYAPDSVSATPACTAYRHGMFGFTAHKTGGKKVSTFLNRLLAMRMADQVRHSLPPRLLYLMLRSCKFI